MNAFVSVYCDWAATEDSVRAATEGLALPPGVVSVKVESSSDTLGCRVAVDLLGTFDEKAEGRGIARLYASQLSEALGMPAFALHDLITAGGSEW
ncbi:hypothetical protein BH09ACT7_BH09ACT7_23550 [soil metagenome]